MIRMLAAVLVGMGVWMLVGHWASYMHVGSALRIAGESLGTGIAIALAAQLLIPILKLLAGLGLFARKSWIWPCALVALAMDVVTSGISIQRFLGLRAAGAPAPAAA